MGPTTLSSTLPNDTPSLFGRAPDPPGSSLTAASPVYMFVRSRRTALAGGESAEDIGQSVSPVWGGGSTSRAEQGFEQARTGSWVRSPRTR